MDTIERILPGYVAETNLSRGKHSYALLQTNLRGFLRPQSDHREVVLAIAATSKSSTCTSSM